MHAQVRVSHSGAVTGVAALLVLEALFFAYLAWAILGVYRAIPGAPLVPSVVLSCAVRSAVLAALAALYWFDRGRVRTWFWFPALVMLGYGIWMVAVMSGQVMSWAGALHGDLAPLEVVSGVGFISIGVLEAFRNRGWLGLRARRR